MAISVTATTKAILDAAIPQLKVQTGYSLGDLLETLQKDSDAKDTILAAVNQFAQDNNTTTGLTWGYKSGIISIGDAAPVVVAAGTVSLTASQTNYVECDRDGVVSKNTSGFTKNSYPIAIIATSGSAINTFTDRRPFGFVVGEGVLEAPMLEEAVATEVAQLALSAAAESSNHRDVTIQAQDINGNDQPVSALLEIWLADSATGWELTTAPDGGVSVQNGTAADVPTAGKRLRVMTDTNGKVVIRITESGVKTVYVRAKLGDKVYTSSAVAFA